MDSTNEIATTTTLAPDQTDLNQELQTASNPEPPTDTTTLPQQPASPHPAPQQPVPSQPVPSQPVPSKDTQSRKYLLTINNPTEKNASHDQLKAILSGMKSLLYWCMADEVGGQERTYHTHLFLASKNPIRFSTIQKRFPGAHIDSAYGNCQQNRDYIRKEGRYANTEKSTTSVPGTFEEWGTMPDDSKQGSNKLMEVLYNMVADGMTDYQIITQNPDFIPFLDKIRQIRLTILQENAKEKWRDLEVIYISGATGLGKTRSIMEGFGYANVFRVTDYIHPFDTYEAQDILLFEEFASSVRMQDMLNYLDGYPLKLPARYSDRQACYTKVFLTSNLPLEKQYQNIQSDDPQVWEAFLRRIHKVRTYQSDGYYTEWKTADYLNRFEKVKPEQTPFYEQIKIKTAKETNANENTKISKPDIKKRYNQ